MKTIDRPLLDRAALSAHSAGAVIKRVKPIPVRSQANIYKVIDEKTNTITEGTFKIIAALCPKIKTNTLKRRLINGDRTLALLRRTPSKKPRTRSLY